MDTPFAIATAVEKEAGNNYRIDIEIIVPVTLEKFRLDLNELVDQPKRAGRISGEPVTVTPARRRGLCLPASTLGDRAS